MKKSIIMVILVFTFLFPPSLWPQSENIKTTNPARYGLGFQRITWNCWGLSIMANFTRNIAIEGLFGLVGDRQAYGIRGLFRFFSQKNFNFYGYGLIGAETVEEWGAKETGLLLGSGIGFEFNLERILANLISLGFHVEMGVENLSGYVLINANYTSFIYSAGFHIRI